MPIIALILAVFTASQVYWARHILVWARRLIRPRGWRGAVLATALALYLALAAYNFGYFGRRGTPVHLTWREALLAAPFLCWAVSSLVAFLVALPFALARRLAPPPSPGRRAFLQRTARVATAAPFLAGAYGLLYGRLNLETTIQPVRLPHLPKGLDGFRLLQLSDIHIGPFMPAEQIRHFVAMANELKPDLVALTGDFVTFDPGTQKAVVEALSGLRAPFGLYGCLGNHDAWANVEHSLTVLFRQAGVRILRGQSAAIAVGGGQFNLMGVDFQSQRRFGPSAPMAHVLENIEELIVPGGVNILLSHNPDTFDRAAELGIDLSLAGHTHGGQAALEFISPQLAPSRLVTPYVSGLFTKPGGQLYVNRGIGTIGVPVRVGAPPEITVYVLTRA